MPPRSNPTARQARLGAELRKLREAAGMAAREAGAELGGNQAQISHIEAGRWGVSAERVRRLATLYSASDKKLVDALCTMAEERVKGWWEEYRGVLGPGFLDIAELEHYAPVLRSLHAVNLPGVFQTASYARAVYHGHVPALPVEELETRVEFRMRRREVLDRPEPPRFVAIIHEAALRMRYGGEGVAREQLAHLQEAAERPAVEIRIIPFSIERYIEATQPVLYADGVVPHLDTVRIDGPVGGVFLAAEADLKKYRMLLDAAEHAALDSTASRRLIHRIAHEL